MNSNEMLDKIYSITQELYGEMCHNQSENFETSHKNIFRNLTDLGRLLVNADRASFWKWDKKTHTLWTTAQVGENTITIPENTGLVGKAIRFQKTIVVNDPANDPDFNSDVDKKTGYETKSILVMPVANCSGEVIGAYQAINKLDGNGFDLKEDSKALSLAAFICGITLESDLYLEDAQHDRLTGLKNRQAFNSDMNYYKHIMTGENARTISMFICDIDFFKKFNDTYGHNAGDAVLRHVAQHFRMTTRACDNVYRWGGEEFIVVMPDYSLKEAAMAAENIRESLCRSICHFEDQEFQISMSFGVTTINPDKPIEENIRVADDKLYTAKETGRNRVVC